MAQYAHLSNPDPEWAKVAETYPIPQIVSVEEFARTETELRKKYHAANRPTRKLISYSWIDAGVPIADVPTAENDDLIVKEQLLAVEEGENPLRTYVPKRKDGDPSDGFPVLVWMYGGGKRFDEHKMSLIIYNWPSFATTHLGFAVGSLDDDDKLLRDLALTFRIVCVSADYRKTPHYPYPTPINDSYACLKWVNTCSMSWQKLGYWWVTNI